MNTQDEKTLGEAILKAYKRYCREVIAFSAAKAYLLKVNIAALQGIAPIKIAHNECSNALKPEYKNPLVYFESRLYITLIAAFELFVQDIVVAVVTAYPRKLVILNSNYLKFLMHQKKPSLYSVRLKIS